MVLHDVLLAVAHTQEEPGLALRAGLDDRVQHAEHRRDPDAAGDQHRRGLLGHVEIEMPARRLDVDDIAFMELVVEETRGQTRGCVRLVAWRRQLLDRHPVVVAFGAVRERIAADHRLRLAGDVQPEGEVLAGVEGRQGLPVVGPEIERADALAFQGLARDLELAETIPRQLRPLPLEPAMGHEARDPLPEVFLLGLGAVRGEPGGAQGVGHEHAGIDRHGREKGDRRDIDQNIHRLNFLEFTAPQGGPLDPCVALAGAAHFLAAPPCRRPPPPAAARRRPVRAPTQKQERRARSRPSQTIGAGFKTRP